MNTKTFRTLNLILLLAGLSLAGLSINAQAKKKGETISTASKLVITKLKAGDGDAYEIRGKATFTLTAANMDDSIAGTLVYALPDDARQKIAQLAGKSLDQVPATITENDVVATFQKTTSCPVIHLEFQPRDVTIAGVKNHFNRFVLDVNQGGHELNLLVCKWSEQINAGRARRGIIARMNVILTGEDPNGQ